MFPPLQKDRFFLLQQIRQTSVNGHQVAAMMLSREPAVVPCVVLVENLHVTGELASSKDIRAGCAIRHTQDFLLLISQRFRSVPLSRVPLLFGEAVPQHQLLDLQDSLPVGKVLDCILEALSRLGRQLAGRPHKRLLGHLVGRHPHLDNDFPVPQLVTQPLQIILEALHVHDCVGDDQRIAALNQPVQPGDGVNHLSQDHCVQKDSAFGFQCHNA